MCLLDLLIARGDYELVVAHVDHGIRDDSVQDLRLVRRVAQDYGLRMVHTVYSYSKDTSENELRDARYSFLREQMRLVGAQAILVGHHADDLLETSIMNVRRGTDRYGAAGGMSRKSILRPLIRVHKNELLDYAQKHNLSWREDSTNQDLKYTRNKIRHEVIPAIDVATYRQHVSRLADLNQKIDSELAGLVSISEGQVTIPAANMNHLGLRDLEVLVAYALRQARTGIELSQPRIAELARTIMLGADKISFSITATDCIIIDIP